MMEREIKVAIEDYNKTRRILSDKGRLLGSEEQIDVYLGSKCLQEGSALRVRMGSSSGAWITYKGPLVEDVVKTREEVEVKVDNFESALRIFILSGFKELIRVKKTREAYLLDGLVVELDLVDGLGAFVEIEVKDDEELSRARGIISLLGIKWAPIKEGYAELLAKKIGKGEQRL